jgi:hypothetical protein
MKEIYYTYNNEAISSCIFLSILNYINSLDIARSCLLLPFLLDDRTISSLQKTKYIEVDLDQFIKQQPRLFLSFNKRYLSLLPVTINSLMLLNKSDQIDIGKNITTKSTFKIENIDLGDRFNKINEVIPILLLMIDKYSTTELYKILNIQL